MNTDTVEFDLKKFYSYREDNRLEVKAANGGLPKSLWDTYSSLANTYGGCIICGVAERNDGSWKTTGLKNPAKLKKDFWDTIHNKQKVSLCLVSESDLEEYNYGEDVILVIKVPRARKSQRPVYLNNDVFGASFRRDHEGDYRCTESEVRAMIRDSADETPDQRVLERKLDFNYESVKAYRKRYDIRHEGSAWSRLSDEEFLVKIGAADDEGDKIKPTAAGLLMFGEEYRITKEYPEFFLDYREHMDSDVRWTDRINSQEPEWSGNVFDFYTRVSQKLLLELKKPFRLVDHVRVEETAQHDAVREALVNCLVNTDFYQSWSVVVEKYPDKIVFANPGTIITGKKQMLKGGISQPRNKGLFKMFNLIGLGEHAGSGVPDIFTAWNDAGLDEPVVDELFGGGNPDRTILTLPLASSKNLGTNLGTSLGTDLGTAETESETKSQLLEFCSEPRSKAEIQEQLGIKSERYVRQILINSLLESGELIRTIPDKPNSPKQRYVRKK